jgi:uncharacterized RDD family membrane protein YckC
MSNKFFIAENGKKSGPFNLDELKAMNLSPETLVWTEGFTDWTAAKHVPLLKDFIRSSPPPLPNQQMNTPPPPAGMNTASSASTGPEDADGRQLAGFRERLGAHLINCLAIALPIVVFTGEAPSLNEDLIGMTIILSPLFGITGAVAYRLWGGNVGHHILGLEVVSTVTGKMQNNARMGLFREFLKSALGILLIPTIWLLFDSRKQNTYDKIMKTIVVKKK